MISSLHTLRHPVVLAAFEGWNDAGNSATEAIDFFKTNYPTDFAWELDSEDYYDFQQSRPRICLVEKGREIEWPATSVHITHLPERDLVLVAGQEPNLRWRGFCGALISFFRTISPEMVIGLGAILDSTTHTRPTEISISSNDPNAASDFGCKPSDYEGPTGILGVLMDASRSAQFTVASLWAHVPNYVSSPPNPKATLALLRKLAYILNLNIDVGELPSLASTWEQKVGELVAKDPETSEYVTFLERTLDWHAAIDQDAIAAEVERFLRQRDM